MAEWSKAVDLSPSNCLVIHLSTGAIRVSSNLTRVILSLDFFFCFNREHGIFILGGMWACWCGFQIRLLAGLDLGICGKTDMVGTLDGWRLWNTSHAQ